VGNALLLHDVGSIVDGMEPPQGATDFPPTDPHRYLSSRDPSHDHPAAQPKQSMPTAWADGQQMSALPLTYAPAIS